MTIYSVFAVSSFIPVSPLIPLPIPSRLSRAPLMHSG